MWKGQYSIGGLAAWCKQHGVHLHQVAIEYSDNRGNALVAQGHIVNNGTGRSPTVPLLTIPEDVVISAKNVLHYATENDDFRQLLEAVGYQVMIHITQTNRMFLS